MNLRISTCVAAALWLLTIVSESVLAQPIDTGLFTQNRIRQCDTDTSCIGGDPTIQVQSDFDLSVTGQVFTQVNSAELGAQAATSAGYDGVALTPAMTAYAYTSGPQRYTLGNFGFQKYTFLEDGQVTLTGTVTWSHSGQVSPSSQNPRGRVRARFMSFQFDDNEFDASDCNLFVINGANYGASNIAGVLNSCVTQNGQPFGPWIIDFVGLQNVQIADFSIPNTPVNNGSEQAQLVVDGNAGDVFFLGADLSIQAHLGGWADTGNTLTIEVDKPAIVQPAFDQQSFEPAPARTAGIDIKPGDLDNCVNINGAGVVPVGILGSDALDVTEIDLDTLSFGGLVVRNRGMKGPLCSAEYVDGDTQLDMVCKFEDDPTSWTPGVGEATLTGAKYDGSLFEGTDTVCLKP